MNFKKILSLVLVCLLIVSLFSFQALAIRKTNDKLPSVFRTIATNDEAIVNDDEEKIKCNATLEDDFEDDSVLVVLKHRKSMELEKYTQEDFSSVAAKSVSDLTECRTNVIINTFKNSIAKNIKRLSGINSLTSLVKNSVSKRAITSKLNEVVPIDTKNIIKKAEEEIETNYPKFHEIIEIRLKEKGKQNVLNAIKKIQDCDDVLIAEPNYIHIPCKKPKDTKYSEQWALTNMNIETAWNTTTGSSSIKVGILDTGIDNTHPDLKGNINTSLSKSFVDNSPLVDNNGHGTEVAGVIGAVGNNSKGIAGACWNISLVSLKTTKDGSGNTAADIKAITYAITKNIDILNFSYTVNGNSLKSELDEYDGIFVCASGNDGKNIDSSNSTYKEIYPSKHTNNNIISVASLKSDNTLASSSNYGKTSVDLAAPGVNIYTTTNNSDNRYKKVSGTSFAAPQVTGVAALIKSKYSMISYKGLRSAILDNVTSASSLSGKVKTGGKLNASKALSAVSEHNFTIKYNNNGGTGTMSNTTVTYGIPTVLRKNTFTKPVNHFVGWTAHRSSDNKWFYDINDSTGWYVEGSQPSGASKHVYADQDKVLHTSSVNNDIITFYAKWETNTYTIKFKGNTGGGLSMTDQLITYGKAKKLSKNTFLKKGYTFIGWYGYRTSDNKWLYTDGDLEKWYRENEQPEGYNKKLYPDEALVSKTSTVNQDVVNMYAQWKPDKVSIEFEAENAIGSKETVIFENDKSFSLGSNTFTKPGYKFFGWIIHSSDEEYYLTNDTWSEKPSNELLIKLIKENEQISFCIESGISLIANPVWVDENIIIGDVNFDGIVDANDALSIQQFISNMTVYDDFSQYYAADYNQDGKVNIQDVSSIQKHLIGGN